MIKSIIIWSIQNRILILILSIIIAIWGVLAVKNTSLDAIPDLSDVQVIIKTTYKGQSPLVVENQVTYPISNTMLAVPNAKAVRGYSFFEDSYVYIVFEEGTDLYNARSRVLEYLSQASKQLPQGVEPTLGPDANSTGWIYEYILVGGNGENKLSDLRSLQDWFFKRELQSVKGVAEVASLGGFVKQYQIEIDPYRLQSYGISLRELQQAIKDANHEVSGAMLEMAETEFMIHSKGYLTNENDIKDLMIKWNQVTNKPILLKDLAKVWEHSDIRRGIADLDGKGEVVGGIIVMQQGKNALDVIKRVKAKLKQLEQSLPKGIKLVTTYDRSQLIHRAVDNLQEKLLLEFLVITLICLIFLWHLRSSLVAVISLPFGIMIAFIIMQKQGINANIMSLGGIAIAIGAMVDMAVVMIENAHKHLEHWKQQHSNPPNNKQHWAIITQASIEVAPALFFSLMIITLSFIPVFALEAEEGRLFHPLAYTKTYAMAAAAGLAITLIPVLMGYFIRGKIPQEKSNPLSCLLITLYRPLLKACLKMPWIVLTIALLITASSLYPLSQLGAEFMPELEEGDILYMPTTLPGISTRKAGDLLQQSDRLIKTIPEVYRVFGKVGRADTATDPAPMTMLETTILLKPKPEWRAGMTHTKIIEELDKTVNIPGLTNAWTQPIKARIDMLSTGIKTPLGIKIAGNDLKQIEKIGKQLESTLKTVDGTAAVFSDRANSGHYIEITPDRLAAAKHGLTVADIQNVIQSAIGGVNITQTVEGRETYPVNLRYPLFLRDDMEKLGEIPVANPSGITVALSEVADIYLTNGPAMIKTENAQLNGWVFIEFRDIDLGTYLKNAQEKVSRLKLPTGYSVTWVGQYESILRVQDKMFWLVPITLLIIFALLYLSFNRIQSAFIILLTLPFAIAGSFWLLWLLQFNLSTAVAVGLIALAGIAAEFGIIMLLYLDRALEEFKAQGKLNTKQDLQAAIYQGAVLRLRPKVMTLTIIIAGLVPIMIGSGAGSAMMQRIAAPMIGGMITAPLLSLFVIPVIYYLWKRP